MPTELEARVEHLLCELPGGEGGGAGGVAAGPGAGPPSLLLHLIGPPRDARLCIILLLDQYQPQKLSFSQTLKSFSYFPPFPSALLKV